MLAKKTLELNPHHPVIKELLQRVKQAQAAGEEVDPEVAEYGTLLYNMGLLNSGFLIEDPTSFITPLQKLLKVGFGIRKDAPIEEIEVDIGGDEEADEAAQETPEEPDVEGEAEVDDGSNSAQREEL
jgi:heat shock protein beta